MEAKNCLNYHLTSIKRKPILAYTQDIEVLKAYLLEKNVQVRQKDDEKNLSLFSHSSHVMFRIQKQLVVWQQRTTKRKTNNIRINNKIHSLSLHTWNQINNNKQK